MPPIFIVPMPAMQPQQQQGAAASNAAPTGQPQIRRPPWIKDGPEPLPMPTAPWTLARARDRRISREEPPQNTEPAPVRKQSKITIIPSQPSAENGVTEAKVKQEVINAAAAKKQEPPQERKIDIQVQSTKKEEAPKQQNAAPRERKLDIQMESKQKKEEPPKERKVEIERKPSVDAAPANQRKSSTDVAPLQRKQSQTSIPPKPPAPPMPPPPPPAPGMDRKSLPPEKAAKIEALRSRPRKRPDWGAMMKEVESGRKLKHVECNDRSTPLLPKVKVKDTFMYESEKPNVHNRLLKEIQGGVQLKRVQCNDRSKPNLEGLRKFRRQMTIEEQIQKAEEEPDEEEPDELDDIDNVRDDLQSTKQMLALELRNKEAVERENKRLLAKILNLEVELEKEKFNKQSSQAPSAAEKKNEQEKEVKKLKEVLNETQQQAQEMEEKYHETASQLDMTKTDLEEEKRKVAALERKLATLARDIPLTLPKQPSAKKLASMTSVNTALAAPEKENMRKEEDEDEETEEEEYTETEEEEDSSEDEEKAAALREKRLQRELRLLNTKVWSLKEKEDNTRKERRALRMQLKNQQAALKTEKKKYKALQKEVDKMSKLMNEDDEEEPEEDEEEEEESEEEESEESSSEESEGEESEGDLPGDAPVENRRKNYMERAKRHESILSVLRKGNYLLKANVDKLKDDLFKQKEMSLALQEDLNSVLAELG